MRHGAFILARYSTDNQEQDSIEVQVEKCTTWCSQNNLSVLDVFADFAVSGMKSSRPQFDRMMEQLRSGGADTVVIYDQSRMFRKMTAWFQFRDELEDLGVRVVSVTQPMIGGDLRDPANFLTEGSMALFNQMWVLQARQKVIEKMRYMARNGLHTGGPPPLGYKVVDQRLAIDPAEADTVRRIFTMYADGISYRKIASVLNGEGVVTRRGGPFGANSLHDLLNNKKYIGTLVYGKATQRSNGTRNSHSTSPHVIELENGCPAIIDRELFDFVQAKMVSRRRTGGRPPVFDNLPLHDKVFCGECQAPMNLHYTGKHRQYSYYTCSAQKRNHICTCKSVRTAWLESAIAKTIRDRLGQPEDCNALLSILREQRNSIQGGAGERMASLVTRRKDICRQLDNATTAILNGLKSETLLSKINALENERDSIDYRIQDLHGTVERISLTDAALDSALDQIIRSVDSEDSAVLSIVYRVEVCSNIIKVWTILDGEPNGKKFGKLEMPPSELPSLPSDVPPDSISAIVVDSFAVSPGNFRTTVQNPSAPPNETEANPNFEGSSLSVYRRPGDTFVGLAINNTIWIARLNAYGSKSSSYSGCFSSHFCIYFLPSSLSMKSRILGSMYLGVLKQ